MADIVAGRHRDERGPDVLRGVRVLAKAVPRLPGVLLRWPTRYLRPYIIHCRQQRQVLVCAADQPDPDH